MSRYIDADELIKEAEKDGAYGYVSAEQIADFPTADVAEVKHGRWIVDREFGNDVMSGEKMVICSVCGKGIFWGKQNYCPNCGSRMDEVDNEN